MPARAHDGPASPGRGIAERLALNAGRGAGSDHRPEARCAMRMPHPTPTSEPLPFDHLYSGFGTRSHSDAVPLSPAAVAHFDALLHELHADAPRVDIERLQQLVDWLLTLSADNAHHVIDSRLERVQELR